MVTMARRKNSSSALGEQIAKQIFDNYDLKNAQDVQEVMKQIFVPIFESMLKGEMENHLGCEKHGRSESSTNSCNSERERQLPQGHEKRIVPQ